MNEGVLFCMKQKFLITLFKCAFLVILYLEKKQVVVDGFENKYRMDF